MNGNKGNQSRSSNHSTFFEPNQRLNIKERKMLDQMKKSNLLTSYKLRDNNDTRDIINPLLNKESSNYQRTNLSSQMIKCRSKSLNKDAKESKAQTINLSKKQELSKSSSYQHDAPNIYLKTDSKKESTSIGRESRISQALERISDKQPSQIIGTSKLSNKEEPLKSLKSLSLYYEHQKISPEPHYTEERNSSGRRSRVSETQKTNPDEENSKPPQLISNPQSKKHFSGEPSSIESLSKSKFLSKSLAELNFAPVSLRNNGVNCYLNSALQGISSCREFIVGIFKLHKKYEHLPKLQAFMGLLQKLFQENKGSMEMSTNSIFREWNKSGQQDSYELLAYVLNQVYNELRSHMEKKEIERRNLEQWLKVPLPMRILMDYEIVCDCGRINFSPVQSDLAFHVTVSNLKRSLQELFDDYFNNDPIEDYKCDDNECQGQLAHRTVKLYKPLPDTICIHLQRTLWNTRRMVKIQGKIEFTEDLVIRNKFCKVDEKLENNKNYSLVSVIVHHGDVSFGHYICYKLYNQRWYYTSDSSVREVSWSVVRDCEAYVLFYEVSDCV